MKRTPAILALALMTLVAWPTRTAGRAAISDETKRVEDAMQVLRDLTAQSDDRIPPSLLERAEAIVVIPNMIKGGFVVGARHGRGIVSARQPRDNGRGVWSPPGFVEMTGGSVGWQIGAQSVDLVLLVMNQNGLRRLLDDRFTLGGELSLTAGPIGRSASVAADRNFDNQILAYSRAKGFFAGATLDGVSLRADRDANEAFYGRELDLREITLDRAPNTRAPMIAANWMETMRALGEPIAETRMPSDDRRDRRSPAEMPIVPPGFNGRLVSMSELAKHPKDYYGKQVMIDGAVEDVYSATVFAIDEDKLLTTGRGVIVVAPTLRRAITGGIDVLVAGEVMKFDKGDIEKRAKGYDLDLRSDLVKRFSDQTVIVAMSIRTKDGEELVGSRVIK